MPNISPRMNAIRATLGEFEKRQRIGTIPKSTVFEVRFGASGDTNLPMRITVVDHNGRPIGIYADYKPTIGDSGMRREEREVMQALAR